MSDIDELRRELSARWAKEDHRTTATDRILRSVADEQERLGQRVQKVEQRLTETSQLANRTSQESFGLETTIYAHLASLQADVKSRFDAMSTESAASRSENRIWSLVIAVVIVGVVVVGALVGMGKLPVESFVPTLMGIGTFCAAVFALVERKVQHARASRSSQPGS
jgi:F0F1-type ATP synthase assembly protein I